jgi:hypothetical protein
MTTADWYAASSALCIVAGTASVWVNYYRTWRAADELLKPDTAPGWAARQSRSDLVGEVEKSRVQAVTRRLQRSKLTELGLMAYFAGAFLGFFAVYLGPKRCTLFFNRHVATQNTSSAKQ